MITKAREKNYEIILMGCPCHMAHNAARHATKAFEKLVIFNAEELLSITLISILIIPQKEKPSPIVLYFL